MGTRGLTVDVLTADVPVIVSAGGGAVPGHDHDVPVGDVDTQASRRVGRSPEPVLSLLKLAPAHHGN